MIKNLTDRLVASPSISGNVFDAKTRGLVLRVGARKRTWCFTYRNGGPPQWLKLGEYPTLSLADARARVSTERGRLANGIDPVRKDAGRPRTDTTTARVRLRTSFGRPLPERSHQALGRRGRQDQALLAAWGTRPQKITRVQVTGCSTRSRTRDSPPARTAFRPSSVGCSRSHSIAVWSTHTQRSDHQTLQEQARDRVLTDDELRALWVALDANLAPQACRALRLLLGQRGAETAEMRWSELDLEGARGRCRDCGPRHRNARA